MAPLILQVARVLVALLCLASAIIALTHWAVRDKKLSPFGQFPRMIRRLSDPIILPLERRIVQAGGNPQNAAWWLFWITVVGGLILLSLVGWALGTIASLGYAAEAGPRSVLRLVVNGIFGLLIACVLIRVVASWLGMSRYSKIMRPFVFLTDWLLEPLRRIVPPLGMFDISPMVAWLLLILARSLVMGLL
jgi:YggT family protein